MNESIRCLEEKVAYLERHVTEQDKAMLELAEEIAGLRRELRALRERSIGGTSEGGMDVDDAPDERPPHH